MPDLFSHAAIAFIVAVLFRVDKRSIVMGGALLPDLLTKWEVVFRYFITPYQRTIFETFHTPLGVFLASLVVAPFLNVENRKAILYLNLGIGTHFILDITQKTSYMLLWPLSWERYSLELFWQEDPIFFFSSIFLLAIYYVWNKIIKTTSI